MIAELGSFSLMVALAVAMVLGPCPSWRRARQCGLDGAGAPAARALFVLVVWRRPAWWRRSCAIDFSVVYVATNSTRALPLRYKVAAFWAARKARCCCGADPELVDVRGQPVQSAICAADGGAHPGRDGPDRVGFLLFILLTSSPFER